MCTVASADNHIRGLILIDGLLIKSEHLIKSYQGSAKIIYEPHEDGPEREKSWQHPQALIRASPVSHDRSFL